MGCGGGCLVRIGDQGSGDGESDAYCGRWDESSWMDGRDI